MAGTRTATLTPNSPLASGTTYSATVKGGSAGVKDVAGNALSSRFHLDLYHRCSPLRVHAASGIMPRHPPWPPTSDTQSIEVGVKFRPMSMATSRASGFTKAQGTRARMWGTYGPAAAPSWPVSPSANETATGWQQSHAAYAGGDHGQYHLCGVVLRPGGQVCGKARRTLRRQWSRPHCGRCQMEAAGGNGVYKYGASGFPTQTFNASNYWVDVVFNTIVPPDTTLPTVSEMSPASGATGVPTGTTVQATFSEAMDASTINTGSFELRAANTLVAAAVSYDSGTAHSDVESRVVLWCAGRPTRRPSREEQRV